MKHKLRSVVLAACAVCALTAVSASAAQAAEFHSEIAKTFLFGEQTVENVFSTTAGKVKCKKAQFSGETTATTTADVTITPHYTECTAFGTAATVTTTGCSYTLTASSEKAGNVEIVCAAGKVITVSVPAGNCSLTIGTQKPKVSSVEYAKGAGGGAARDVLVTSKAKEIAFTVDGPGTICGTVGFHAGEPDIGEVAGEASYTGSVTTKGFKDVAHTEQVGIFVL